MGSPLDCTKEACGTPRGECLSNPKSSVYRQHAEVHLSRNGGTRFCDEQPGLGGAWRMTFLSEISGGRSLGANMMKSYGSNRAKRMRPGEPDGRSTRPHADSRIATGREGRD